MHISKHTLPEKFFTSDCDGGLYDTSKKDWNKNNPIRAAYKFTFRDISTLSQVKATIRNGQWSWPGGYPMFFITKDGGALCFACAKKEFREIARDFINNASTGWRIVCCDINYECVDLHCDNCYKQIEPAYGKE